MARAGSPYVTERYKRLRAAFIASCAPYCAWERCPVPGRLVDVSLPGTHPWGPTVDHTVATSKGGSMWDPSNWRLTHRRCNTSKGDRPAPAPRTSRSW